METKKLFLQEMQMVEGVDKLEVFCGVSNSLAIDALMMPPGGLLAVAGFVLGAWYAGCYW